MQPELPVNNNKLPSQPPGTGIPKPTAAVKGTSKPTPNKSAPLSRDPSHSNLSTPPKVAIAAISPMKNTTEQQLSESSGQQSNSSESSSVICKRDHISEDVPPPPPDPPKEAEKQQNGEEDTPSLNIEPMRPLLRGYCSTLTLPSRQHGRQYGRLDGLGDYCEIGVVNGYMSDGEMVKSQVRRDVADGYVSEGGAMLYNRRLQTVPTG